MFSRHEFSDKTIVIYEGGYHFNKASFFLSFFLFISQRILSCVFKHYKSVILSEIFKGKKGILNLFNFSFQKKKRYLKNENLFKVFIFTIEA